MSPLSVFTKRVEKKGIRPNCIGGGEKTLPTATRERYRAHFPVPGAGGFSINATSKTGSSPETNRFMSNKDGGHFRLPATLAASSSATFGVLARPPGRRDWQRFPGSVASSSADEKGALVHPRINEILERPDGGTNYEGAIYVGQPDEPSLMLYSMSRTYGITMQVSGWVARRIPPGPGPNQAGTARQPFNFQAETAVLVFRRLAMCDTGK